MPASHTATSPAAERAVSGRRPAAARLVASVATATTTGPRPANEDRAFTAVSPDDGSWVIAVADGISGSANPHTAAQAATEGLPARIGSLEEMRDAFLAAAARVDAVVPTWEEVEAAWRAEYDNDEQWRQVRLPPEDPVRRWTRDTEFDRRYGAWLATCPATTLCVAAWTPEGRLLVGSMGDTIAAEIRHRPDGPPFARLLVEPHRERIPVRPGVTSYLGLGASQVRILRHTHNDDDAASYNPNLGLVAAPPPLDAAMPTAVVVASDGAWEPLLRVVWAANHADAPESERPPEGPDTVPDAWPHPLPDLTDTPPVLYWTPVAFDHSGLGPAFASIAGPPAPAPAIASRVLEAATILGLDDNATVAVASMAPAADLRDRKSPDQTNGNVGG